MNKILIVDDEPNIVMSLEYAFKKKGFEVFIARDGEEAIQLIQEVLPEIVLLDIMMPKVDGYEVLQYVNENFAEKDIKILFMSAKNKAQDISKGLELGATDYITKPFSVKKVTEKIETLIK
ncbi:MAG: response regulator [Crocinitomicaceae bacterium]|nr:response regulator [Crocinitomicaceae bacterium]